MKSIETVALVFSKTRSGIPISDEELLIGMEGMRAFLKFCELVGDSYSLVATDLRSRIMVLEGMDRARKH